jgi:2-(1,2-epoxy-1,2-dihydrophenyl)acetyl-CoA isomerase
LPRLIGEQRTRRFFFDNEVLAADESKALGLLDEVVPTQQLVQRAVDVARTWGAWAVRSREGTKRLLEAQSVASFADQLETERGLIAAAAGTRDFAEGTTAFTEKRKAKFG